jgi:uncharacterized repeat protein (TIGR01451 family)
MKKNCTLVFLFFGMLFSNISFGQLVSNGNIETCVDSGSANLLTMLELNGVSPTANQVTFNLVSSTNSDLFLMGNTVIFGATLPTGTWTLTYQACETANTSNCVTAQVTVRIIKPIITNVFQPTCNIATGSVVLNNLPSVPWTVRVNGGPVQFQGNSSSYVIPNLPSGEYVFEVSDGSCMGTTVPITIELQPFTYNDITFVPQTCASSIDSIIINNLPQGTWNLTYTKSDGSLSNTISGTGLSYTISGLTPGYYYFSLNPYSQCNQPVGVEIGSLQNSISGTMTASYVDYNNDGITNLGDIIAYNVAITNNLTCVMDTVTYSIQNSPNTIGTLTNLAAGATENGILNYPLTQADINNGSVFNWIAVNGLSNGYENYIKIFNQQQTVILTLPDGIKLNAFIDTNNNGVQNNGEQNVNSGNFTYQLNNGVSHFLYSQNGTNIIYESNPANTYTLGYNLFNNCTGEYNVSLTDYTNVSVPIGSGITTYNFPITQNPCQDIQIHISGWAPRPGFEYGNYITYKNVGNQVMNAGTITYTKDPALFITSISAASAITTATGFSYSFTNLLPNETRTVYVTMYVPVIPIVALGQLVNTSVSITTPINDINPSNNSDTLTQPIVGSYDPNDKTESHGGKILHSSFTANDYLTYMIRFENTGTASAINIRVNDILDEKLDETSLKMVRASHSYVLDRVGSSLTWRFDGVNLPPSVLNDEITGHGYIVFQVKPKPGFALGDIIPNTADIYFDFNPAIVTNTCTTEFVPFLGVNAFDSYTFEYHPNPTSGIVTFAMKNTAIIDNIEVTDVLGKTLISKTVHFSYADIDLSSLNQGIYLVKLKANGQTKTIKITKN